MFRFSLHFIALIYTQDIHHVQRVPLHKNILPSHSRLQHEEGTGVAFVCDFWAAKGYYETIYREIAFDNLASELPVNDICWHVQFLLNYYIIIVR